MQVFEINHIKENQMKKWKLAFFVTFLLLIGSNIFWLYVVINSGVTYTYQQASLDELKHAHEFLGGLIMKECGKCSQKDVLHLLRQSYPGEFIVEEGNEITINRVTVQVLSVDKIILMMLIVLVFPLLLHYSPKMHNRFLDVEF